MQTNGPIANLISLCANRSIGGLIVAIGIDRKFIANFPMGEMSLPGGSLIGILLIFFVSASHAATQSKWSAVLSNSGPLCSWCNPSSFFLTFYLMISDGSKKETFARPLMTGSDNFFLDRKRLPRDEFVVRNCLTAHFGVMRRLTVFRDAPASFPRWNYGKLYLFSNPSFLRQVSDEFDLSLVIFSMTEFSDNFYKCAPLPIWFQVHARCTWRKSKLYYI